MKNVLKALSYYNSFDSSINNVTKLLLGDDFGGQILVCTDI